MATEMGGLSDQTAQDLLAKALGLYNTSHVSGAFVALFSDAPSGATAGTELASGTEPGYLRKSVVFDSAIDRKSSSTAALTWTATSDCRGPSGWPV